MSTFKYQEIWELMNIHNFRIDLDTFNQLKCIICQSILKNAHQAPCGCRYCQLCIQTYFHNDDITCPGAGEDCSVAVSNWKNFIQPDHPANREIALIKVICPIEFCNTQYELYRMREHIETHGKCPFIDIGCREPVSLDTDHFQHEIYNHSDMIVSTVGHLQSQLNSGLLDIKNEVGRLENIIGQLRETVGELSLKYGELSADMMSSKCAAMETEKKALERDKKLHELIDEYHQKHEQQCNHSCPAVTTDNMEIMSKLNSLLKEKHDFEEFSRCCRSEMDELRNRLTTMEKMSATEADFDSSIIDRKRRRIIDKFAEESPKSTSVAVTKSGSQSPLPSPLPIELLHSVETREFHFNRFTQLLARARGGSDRSVVTEPFDSVNGYRLRLVVFPNGNGQAVGTHLSVAIQLLPGANDDALSWPMMHSVKFCLVNQLPPGEFRMPSVDIVCHFARPSLAVQGIVQADAPIGPQRFIKLKNLLGKGCWLKDDSIIVRLSLQIV